MNLDDIIRRAIPDDPKDCRIKKAQKEAKRFEMKRDLLYFISKNFVPKPDKKETQP